MTKEDMFAFYEFAKEVAVGILQRDELIKKLQADKEAAKVPQVEKK